MSDEQANKRKGEHDDGENSTMEKAKKSTRRCRRGKSKRTSVQASERAIERTGKHDE
jgi:hypothetical protein